MNRRVLAAVDDIFFAAKIRGAAEAVGVAVEFARDPAQALEKAKAEAPSLIIADLHSQRCDPFALAERLKSDQSLADVPLLGFFSHAQAHLAQRARAAGFDTVLTRSAFTARIGEVLTGENSLSGED